MEDHQGWRENMSLILGRYQLECMDKNHKNIMSGDYYGKKFKVCKGCRLKAFVTNLNDLKIPFPKNKIR